MKRRNAKRREKEFARAYGGAERVAFVKSLGCLVRAHGGCEGEVENAHVVGGGVGRKSDAKHVVPLCSHHHRYLHSVGRDYFEEVHDVSLFAAAVMTQARWVASCVANGREP